MNTPRLFFPFIIVFVFLSLLTLAAWKFSTHNNIDTKVLLVSNALFFSVAALVFFLQKKGFKNSNPNKFVRSILTGMMVKMFFCVVAVLIYTIAIGDGFNKKAVFISLFFYLIYLAVEVKVLMKLNKQSHA
ncbi:MAG: hypothetical protein ABIT07_06550 [Ferruginibacter sp.]